ncbi:MAG: ABC transporter permease, partial [Bulleidia sp.]
MNAFKRAWAYVRRKPTKTILLMITFFLIGNLVILGLGISEAADNAKILTRKSMRAVVSYEVDYNSYYDYVNGLTDQDEIDKAYQNYPQIDPSIAQEIAKDERVIAFNYMVNTAAYSVDFDNVPLGNEENRGTTTYIDENGNEVEYKDPNIMIYANMYPNMIEFAEGTFSVASGNMFTQSDIDNANNVVLITQELADQNNLHVGDTIKLTTLDLSTEQDYISNGISQDDLDLELEICGIYTTTNDVDPSSENYKWMSPYESPKNIVLMPMTSYAAYMENLMDIQVKVHPEYYEGTNIDDMKASASIPTKVVYLLDDPLHVDQFVEDHTSQLGQYTILNANNETFKKMARPLDTLSFFANIVVWIVVVNAVVIISLVTALTLKTREYEIGVLLSIGVSKAKVVLQLFAELFMIAVIGFGLAAVSGSLLAGKVGD